MANNYVQTSVEIPAATPKEVEWFERYAAKVDVLDFTDEEMEKWQKAHPDVDGENWPDFDYSVEPDGDKQFTIYIYSEECGNLDNICAAIQDFLKTFRPKKAIGVEWAFTCSSMRPGEFGGGAAFITAKGIKYTNTGDWLRKQRAAWEKRNARKR